MTRREFLRLAGATFATAAAPAVDLRGQSIDGPDPRRARPPRARLDTRFGDLRRHFIFEYYPWYGTNPYRHWEEGGHVPPIDLASNYMPKLGAYDSKATTAIEQHARWILDSGAGAINVSWWGRDSREDSVVPVLMDVMAAHGIQVTFHLEPYSERHAFNYASDVEYLIRQYGDRRRWDCMLMLEGADGSIGPVFKSFRTILPARQTDCHGVVSDINDYAGDADWRQQTDRVRETFRRDFDRVTLLADSSNMDRTRASGFDGIAIYDNYVRPDSWRQLADGASSRDLVFSFNVNPGFDGVIRRDAAPDSCYRPLPFEPPSGSYDWFRDAERERAAAASAARVADSFHSTVALQTDASLANVRHGFFLVYVTSFNEWFEGHQFEPMKGADELTAAERAIGYHNPADGSYRLTLLKALLASVLE